MMALVIIAVFAVMIRLIMLPTFPAGTCCACCTDAAAVYPAEPWHPDDRPLFPRVLCRRCWEQRNAGR